MKITTIADAFLLGIDIHRTSLVPNGLWQAKLTPAINMERLQFKDDSGAEFNLIGNGSNPDEALCDLENQTSGKTMLMKLFLVDAAIEFKLPEMI